MKFGHKWTQPSKELAKSWASTQKLSQAGILQKHLQKHQTSPHQVEAGLRTSCHLEPAARSAQHTRPVGLDAVAHPGGIAGSCAFQHLHWHQQNGLVKRWRNHEEIMKKPSGHRPADVANPSECGTCCKSLNSLEYGALVVPAPEAAPAKAAGIGMAGSLPKKVAGNVLIDISSINKQSNLDETWLL